MLLPTGFRSPHPPITLTVASTEPPTSQGNHCQARAQLKPSGGVFSRPTREPLTLPSPLRNLRPNCRFLRELSFNRSSQSPRLMEPYTNFWPVHSYCVQLASSFVPGGGFALDSQFASLNNDFFAGAEPLQGTNVTYQGNFTPRPRNR